MVLVRGSGMQYHTFTNYFIQLIGMAYSFLKGFFYHRRAFSLVCLQIDPESYELDASAS